MSSVTPITYGPYLLTHRLAASGVAELFAARAKGSNPTRKPMVIKRLIHKVSERPDFIQSLASQGRIVCNLEHPNILQVYELGEIDDTFYIAMEYVHGFNARQLRRVLSARRQQLPLSLALYVISEVLKGLGHAHRAEGPDGETGGVIHQGVSPSNILLSLKGEVKISDFDIPQVYCNINVKAGERTDKFGYMAPEQLVGARVDHRADLFSVGIILAELLTGQRLFKGQSAYETLDRVLNVRLGPIKQQLMTMPEDVVGIIRRSMQRSVNARYQSAGEFREAVDEAIWRRRFKCTAAPLADYLAQQVIPHLQQARKRITTPPPPDAAFRATENTAIFPADLTAENTALLRAEDLATENTAIFPADLTAENTALLARADLTAETTAILSHRGPMGEREPSRPDDLAGENTAGTAGADLEDQATTLRSAERVVATTPVLPDPAPWERVTTVFAGTMEAIAGAMVAEGATRVSPPLFPEDECDAAQGMFGFDPDPTPVVEMDHDLPPIFHINHNPTVVEEEFDAEPVIVADLAADDPTDTDPSREAQSPATGYPPHLMQTVVTPRWFEELLQSMFEEDE